MISGARPTSYLLIMFSVLLVLSADGLAPQVACCQTPHEPGSLMIGASLGYGLGGVRLKHGESTISRQESNFSSGNLRAGIFIASNVAVGAQYQEWSEEEQSARTMNMHLTAATITWYPTEGVYAQFGLGAGDLEVDLSMLAPADYPPDTPVEERPAGTITTYRFSENAVGILLAGGYELLLSKALSLGIQADVWYLETLEDLSSLVSSVSLNANLYLW